MNALEVATPASIVAGSSASGSSQWPLTARLSPTSIAESPSVAARHSRTPVSSERSAAGDEPVPGLLKDRKVVVPPNAAATESWKNRSGSASDATRVCVWTSTTPGRTSSPVASITSSAPAARPLRSGSIAVIRPPSIATSAIREPPAVTTVPPRTSRAVTAPPRSPRHQRGHPGQPHHARVMPSIGITDENRRQAPEIKHQAAPRAPHSTSRIEIVWAPSHRQRRPISRRRSSQPSSATTVAK